MLSPSPDMVAGIQEFRSDGCVRRVVRFGSTTQHEIEAYWEYRGEVLPPPFDGQADMALIACVFAALRQGGKLHVRGRVSRTLLRNLQCFAEAWVAWRPNAYRTVEFSADEEVDDTRADDMTAVLAYSNGMDSAATLLRHINGLAGRDNRHILVACMVHGFDIRVEDEALSGLAATAATETLAHFRVPLVICRTNWRDTLCTDWESEFFPGLIATLSAYAGMARSALVANDITWFSLPYGLPWASNQATNPLLGSGRFAVVTDGAGLTRVDTARIVAKDPFVQSRLRVCYHAVEGRLNCGVCSKCIRRQVQFLAAGADPGPAFPVRPGFWTQIVRQIPRSAMQINFTIETIAEARCNGTASGSWFTALRIALLLGRIRWMARAAKHMALGRQT